jgi:hypothetical protein
LLYGHDRETATMQASGQGLDALRREGWDDFDLLYFATQFGKAARIDVALDTSTQGSVDQVWQAIENSILKTSAKTLRRMQSKTQDERDGYTIYIGSRTSDQFTRVYDKSAQLKSLAEFVKRIEWVGQRRHARTMADACHDSQTLYPAAAAIRRQIPYFGVAWADDLVDDNALEPAPLNPRRPTQADKFAQDVIVPFLSKRWQELTPTSRKMIWASISPAWDNPK